MTRREPFGNHWAGDGLFNIPVGGEFKSEVAFYFVAPGDVPVNRLRFFNAYSHEKPGYHSGTGGSLLITLSPVEGKQPGLPIKAVADQPVFLEKELLVPFDATATLKKGVPYEIVFRNVDRDPLVNWVSVNTMAVLAKRPRNHQSSLGVYERSSTGGRWTLFKPQFESVVPIFTLSHSDKDQEKEQITLPGFGGMESWVSEPRRIAGPEMVRQVFKPLNETTVENVAVRIAKEGNPGALQVSLFQEDKLLSEGSIEALSVQQIDTTIAPPNRLGHDWVSIPFPAPVLLQADVEHSVRLSAPAGDAYEVFPLRDGVEFGFSSLWPQAWAEFTISGDTGWELWSAWGKPSNQGDLQLYFNACVVDAR